MRSDWVASLPMYDFPELQEAHDVFWGALAERLAAAGLNNVPRTLTRGVRPAEIWGGPSLLFAQGCEYPLAKTFAGRVRVVAHPVYLAGGCEAARYRSAIVVRAVTGGPSSAVGVGAVAVGGPPVDSGPVADGSAAVNSGPAVDASADNQLAALATLRGVRCAVNEVDSNSGVNLLRASIAPLANGDRFFDSVAVSGSHLRSVQMVASGEADVASIDCVSFAHFQRLYPSLVSGLRVLAWTASSPSLPYVTAGSASDATIQALRDALAGVFDDDALAAVRERLLLRGIDLLPVEGFGEVLALESGAADAGYPVLR